MVEVREIDNGLWRIVHNNSISSNTYIIGNNNTNEWALIDPGLDLGIEKFNELACAVKAASRIDILNVKKVLLTHSHIDHSYNLTFLNSKAEIYMHEFEAEEFEKQNKNLLYGGLMKWAYGAYMQYKLRLPKLKRIKVAKRLKDNEVVNIGGIELKIIHLPGHTKGHIGLYVPSKKALISGDLVFRITNEDSKNEAYTAFGRCDLYSGDPILMHFSMRKAGKLDFEKVLTGHGEIIESEKEISMLKEKLKGRKINF